MEIHAARDKPTDGQGRRVRLGLFVVLFVVFAIAFSAAGYGYYLQQRVRLDTQVKSEIASIADLKAQQVAQWLDRLRGDATANFHSPYLARGTAAFLARPSSPQRRAEMRDRLQAERQQTDLRTIALLDARLRKKLVVGSWCARLGPQTIAMARTAMSERRVVISDLYQSSCDLLHLDVLIPIRPQGRASGEPFAILLERVDPKVFLFPQLTDWSGPGRTAEALLVRRDGDRVVYLSPLKHVRQGAPLGFSLPAGRKDLPAAMAVRGVSGIVEGTDYRGERVLAAIRPVAGSSWDVIVEIDRAEYNRPIQTQAVGTVLVGAAVLLLAGFCAFFLWRAEQAEFTSRLVMAEVERTALAEHVEHLSKYANDIVLFTDEALNVTDANDRAIDAYGYSRGELLSMNVRELRSPAAREGLPSVLAELEKKDGVIYETEHLRKDGTTFPVEASGRLVTVPGRPSYQFIVRDITARRKAGAEIARHQERLRALASELSLAEERERRRIAVDLHDSIGQQLAMTKMRLGALRKASAGTDLAGPVDELAIAIDEALSETRSLTFELSPPVLYELGLEPAVEWLAERIHDQHGLVVTVEDDGRPKPLDSDLRVVLFSVVRELLVNVVKHSGASAARVRMARAGHAVRIVVEDGGVGFRVDEVARRTGSGGHFGLFSIRERLGHLGGRLVVESARGRGTKVTLSAPLAAVKAPRKRVRT